MARCKNTPEIQRTKCELAERLREVRTEHYGERGGPELSRQLALPVRTWYNYEVGVTVPAEVLLRFVELTSVEPLWLLYGRGPKYRRTPPVEPKDSLRPDSAIPLLRRALSLLDSDGQAGLTATDLGQTSPESDSTLLIRVQNEPSGDRPPAPFLHVRRDWIDGWPDCRCIRIAGEAMEPILSDGAFVTCAAIAEEPDQLDGQLVAVRHDGRFIVRWLQVAGRFVLLRAENESEDGSILPIDLDDADLDLPQFRRVLWATTRHLARVENPASARI